MSEKNQGLQHNVIYFNISPDFHHKRSFDKFPKSIIKTEIYIHKINKRHMKNT